MDSETLILLLIPLVIIQVGLMLSALYDIYRRKGAKGSTALWVIVVIFGEMLGPVIYFLLGRKEEEPVE